MLAFDLGLPWSQWELSWQKTFWTNFGLFHNENCRPKQLPLHDFASSRLFEQSLVFDHNMNCHDKRLFEQILAFFTMRTVAQSSCRCMTLRRQATFFSRVNVTRCIVGDRRVCYTYIGLETVQDFLIKFGNKLEISILHYIMTSSVLPKLWTTLSKVSNSEFQSHFSVSKK